MPIPQFCVVRVSEKLFDKQWLVGDIHHRLSRLQNRSTGSWVRRTAYGSHDGTISLVIDNVVRVPRLGIC